MNMQKGTSQEQAASQTHLSYDERVMMSPEMTKRRDQLVTHNEEEENETGDKDEDG